jgi:hypothetical protein
MTPQDHPLWTITPNMNPKRDMWMNHILPLLGMMINVAKCPMMKQCLTQQQTNIVVYGIKQDLVALEKRAVIVIFVAHVDQHLTALWIAGIKYIIFSM